MTYKQLAKIINEMNEEHQDCTVSVLDHQGEVFGVIGITDASSVHMDEVLDEDHPLLILNGVFNKKELKHIPIEME